jgi:cathepsin B
MRSIIILGLLAVCLSSALESDGITIQGVENLKLVAPFEVYDYESHPFKGYSRAELRQKLGLKGMPFQDIVQLPLGLETSALPDNFLANEQWPGCVHEIRDQQSCGSCWAFAASEVLSDRFCIASQGEVNVVLSPQDMVSCDKSDLGCNGGYLDNSWNYLVNTGIVEDSCYPYTSGNGQTGTCKLNGTKCTDGVTVAKKYKAASFRTYTSVNDIKNDIFTYGPVETGFLVYQDFLSYKSGIYKKTSNSLLGGHAVKVIGWGVDAATKTQYWVVANSWGTSWGEQGHFRIAIGNCCNFESQMMAGLANLS